jgi:hypothetical protein
MALGAILAGAAGGINDSWAERREDAVLEANRAFQERLIEIDRENREVERSEERGYAAIAANKAGILAGEQDKRDKAFESEQNRLDRASREKAAANRSGGKGGAKLSPMLESQIKSNQKEMDSLITMLGDGKERTPEQTEAIYSRLGILANERDAIYQRKQPEKQYKTPNSAAQDDLNKLTELTPEAIAKFDGTFGPGSANKYWKGKAQAENKSQAKDKATAKPKRQSLGEKYPSKEASFFESAINKITEWGGKLKNKNRQNFANTAKDAMERVSVAVEAGQTVNPADLQILESAEGMDWIDYDAKVTIENVFKRARGYTDEQGE